MDHQFPLTGPGLALRNLKSLRGQAGGTGARALRSIMESLMLDIMYDLSERQPGQTYTITEDVVTGKTSLFGPEAA